MHDKPNDTPWTPGPWRVDDYGRVVWPDAPKGLTRKDSDVRTFGYGCGNSFVADLNDGEYHEYADRDEQNANAALIALAPEMAEAILAIVDQRGEWHRGLIAVAEKLRAIGGISHE